MEHKKNTRLFFIWITSLTATLGSLFFSEILKYVPCNLCWYQRACMYPIVILSAIAVAKKNANLAKYILFFSGIGLIISIYHYSITKFPKLEITSICGRHSCNSNTFDIAGFINIPLLSFLSFIIIFIWSINISRERGEVRI
ncbi:disulfide bond formation protein B [Bacillus salipaludis]|uniref:Probable disulfide formation protein n=1 Tax=Bacillus salipaludis TaxID=2547811 RepID=A0A4R5VHY6_9BACI|nr:disulfide oxidoreductase [Bacillus salipaludis]TDK54762.1 disulfide bond formation protein B [Bacillus salipaludis]